MSMHLMREIETLKRMILSLGALVEKRVQKAIAAIDARDAAAADEVQEADLEIDQMEVEVEEECLKTLALHQPVATDLRYVVAVLKINNDLERIGDLAVNIAKRARVICEHPTIRTPYDYRTLSTKTLEMVRLSLDSLMEKDVAKAQRVLTMDDEVDAIHRDTYRKTTAAIRENPDNTDILLNYLSTCRYLERIADYATNIAEDVIYMMEGWIVRHRAGLDGEGPRDG